MLHQLIKKKATSSLTSYTIELHALRSCDVGVLLPWVNLMTEEQRGQRRGAIMSHIM